MGRTQQRNQVLAPPRALEPVLLDDVAHLGLDDLLALGLHDAEPLAHLAHALVRDPVGHAQDGERADQAPDPLLPQHLAGRRPLGAGTGREHGREGAPERVAALRDRVERVAEAGCGRGARERESAAGSSIGSTGAQRGGRGRRTVADDVERDPAQPLGDVEHDLAVRVVLLPLAALRLVAPRRLVDLARLDRRLERVAQVVRVLEEDGDELAQVGGAERGRHDAALAPVVIALGEEDALAEDHGEVAAHLVGLGVLVRARDEHVREGGRVEEEEPSRLRGEREGRQSCTLAPAIHEPLPRPAPCRDPEHERATGGGCGGGIEEEEERPTHPEEACILHSAAELLMPLAVRHAGRVAEDLGDLAVPERAATGSGQLAERGRARADEGDGESVEEGAEGGEDERGAAWRGRGEGGVVSELRGGAADEEGTQTHSAAWTGWA